MPYFYSALRFVPDAARGEAVNLGVIAGDDESGDWDLRLVNGYRRARAIDREGQITTALDFIAGLEDAIGEDEPQLTRRDLERMSIEMRNVVQLSPPAPVIADSSSAAVDTLFEELIVEPGARAASAKKWRAIRSTLDSYKLHEVPRSRIAQRAPVHAGAYTAKCDFAIHNGSAVQLVQCWSFQLQGQDELADQVKAWAWMAGALRHNGGRVSTATSEVEIADDVEIAAVYLPPTEGSESRAFTEAQAAFQDADIRSVPEYQADVIGQSAAERLHVTA